MQEYHIEVKSSVMLGTGSHGRADIGSGAGVALGQNAAVKVHYPTWAGRGLHGQRHKYLCALPTEYGYGNAGLCGSFEVGIRRLETETKVCGGWQTWSRARHDKAAPRRKS